MTGYVIDTVEEAEQMIRNVGFYAAIGMTAARNEGEKQFILERILLELGFSIADLRVRFECLPGTPFDLTVLLDAWNKSESKRPNR